MRQAISLVVAAVLGAAAIACPAAAQQRPDGDNYMGTLVGTQALALQTLMNENSSLRIELAAVKAELSKLKEKAPEAKP